MYRMGVEVFTWRIINASCYPAFGVTGYETQLLLNFRVSV